MCETVCVANSDPQLVLFEVDRREVTVAFDTGCPTTERLSTVDKIRIRAVCSARDASVRNAEPDTRRVNRNARFTDDWRCLIRPGKFSQSVFGPFDRQHR